MDKSKEWHHEFFTSFRPVFDRFPARTTNKQVQYVIKKLGLKAGKTFLDCPCGIGRIALPLARRGIKVTGVDFYEPYLEELRLKAKRQKLKIETVRADMRRLNFRTKFDAAANIWTSLGFFKKEGDNLRVVRNMYRALKPGGRFLVYLSGRDFALSHWEANSWFNIGKTRVFQEYKFDWSESIMRGKWHFLKEGREEIRDIELRMYSCHELVAMFRKAGFADIETYGSLKDEPVSADRPALIVIGTRGK